MTISGNFDKIPDIRPLPNGEMASRLTLNQVFQVRVLIRQPNFSSPVQSILIKTLQSSCKGLLSPLYCMNITLEGR